MAWSGAPVITSLGKNIVRITGVFLAGGAVGTIGLDGGGGDLSLPSTFPSIAVPAPLTMADLVSVNYVNTTPGGGAESRHIHVEKTNGPFMITFTNDGGNDTSPLEIYVQFFHSIIR